MTSPRHSSVIDFIRLVSREVLIRVAALSDPIRSRRRESAFRRVVVPAPTADQAQGSRTPMVVLMVYRARNAHLVRALLIQVGSNADVRLWAFDDVVPEISR